MKPAPKFPCTVYRLRMAARRATRLYDRHLAPAGLGIAQFGLLQTLSMNDGTTVTVLAAALDMDRTTLTRNLTPLVRQGLVRLGVGSDRRSRAVAMTSAGTRKLAEAMSLWRNAQAAMCEAVGDKEIARLHALLDAAVERLPDS